MPSIEARAAQLLDRWLRGYLTRPDTAPLGLDEIADLAYVARQAAEREHAQGADAPCRQT